MSEEKKPAKAESIEDLKIRLESEQNDHEATAEKLAVVEKENEVLKNEILQEKNKASKAETAQKKAENELKSLKDAAKKTAKTSKKDTKEAKKEAPKSVFVEVDKTKYEISPRFRFKSVLYTAEEAKKDKNLIKELIECKSFVLTEV